MVPQETVDAHAARIEALVSRYEVELARAADYLVGRVVPLALSTVKHTPRSLSIVGDEFDSGLRASGYTSSALAFVQLFSEQVQEFVEMSAHMDPLFNETSLRLHPHEVNSLAYQATSSIEVLRAYASKVSFGIRRLLSGIDGDIGAKELAISLSGEVRKIVQDSHVAKDQLMLFFRHVCDRYCKRIELSGDVLEFAYAGRIGDSVRSFCAGALHRGALTRDEISKLDSGQLPSVFLSCGGYGCMHWWQPVAVRRTHA